MRSTDCPDAIMIPHIDSQHSLPSFPGRSPLAGHVSSRGDLQLAQARPNKMKTMPTADSHGRHAEGDHRGEQGALRQPLRPCGRSSQLCK